MTQTYSQINTLTLALGETEVQHDVTLTNTGSTQIFETKTRIKLVPGQVADIRVKGDKYNQGLANNIQQLNALLGYDAVQYVSEPASEEGGEPDYVLTNASYAYNLNYTNGTIDFAGDTGIKHAFALSRPLTPGKSVALIWPGFSNGENAPFEQVYLLISPYATVSEAVHYRNQVHGAYVTDLTTSGPNNGIKLFKTVQGESAEVSYEAVDQPLTAVEAKLLSAGNIQFKITDRDSGEIHQETITYTVAGQQMYAHAVMVLREPDYSQVDSSQLFLSLSLDGNAA
jgi:hypothetical protein